MSEIVIITPTRMRPDFLRRAILSVQSQTFQDWEYVIVADHCPGYSREVYEKFSGDTRIKFLEMNKGKYIRNNGSDGRNLAIENSDAPYITYLDDDDTLLPNHFEVLLNNIKDRKCHTLFDYCYLVSFEEEILKQNKEFDIILKRHIHDYSGYREKFHWTLMNACHTRSIINKVGKWNPEGTNVVANMIHRLKKEGSYYQIKDVTCMVNSHGGSMRHFTSHAKRIYLEKLECMRPDQTYVYEEYA